MLRLSKVRSVYVSIIFIIHARPNPEQHQLDVSKTSTRREAQLADVGINDVG